MAEESINDFENHSLTCSDEGEDLSDSSTSEIAVKSSVSESALKGSRDGLDCISQKNVFADAVVLTVLHSFYAI